MDDFKRDFDPTDEYKPLDFNPPVENDNNVSEAESEPVPIETVCEEDDDVFAAFDKAEKSTVVTPPTTPQPTQTQQNTPYYNAPQYAQPTYQQQYVQQPRFTPQHTNPNMYPQNPQQNNGYTRPATGQYMPVSPHPTVNPQPVYNPYQQQAPYNPYMPQPQQAFKKEKTPKRTKALIGVLIAFLVIFAIGFIVLCCSFAFDNSTADFSSKNPLEEIFGTEPPVIEDPFAEDFYGFGLTPQYEGDYFDSEIVLQADEGQTQEREEDKKGNTYKSDEKAKDIEFKSIPKDKDNKKYTSQSAYNTVTDAVVSIICYDGEITGKDEDIISEGTGTVISSDGYIVTNSHVIGDSKQYTINVVFNNAKEYEAKIVGYDTRTDLAVIKVDAENLKYAVFSDSSLVEVGQDIVAIGNPGGQSFQNSLTKGIVSAVDRELELTPNVTFIQIDAAINPGNSGGPLCNLYGQIIGINTAKISDEMYEGMGFAIPSNKVAEIANDLIHYGYVQNRVMIGMMGLEVDNELAYSYDVPYGLIITQITEDGPLDNSEIKEYDIITEINGVSVETFQDVFGELEKYKAGDKVTLTLYRLES